MASIRKQLHNLSVERFGKPHQWAGNSVMLGNGRHFDGTGDTKHAIRESAAKKAVRYLREESSGRGESGEEVFGAGSSGAGSSSSDLERILEKHQRPADSIVAEGDVTAVTEFLKKQEEIAVDCEGERLSATGVLCLVTVCTVYCRDPRYFVFDVLDKPLPSALKVILESPTKPIKVMHDCRHDSAALYHQMGVRLENVLDTSAGHLALKLPQHRTYSSGRGDRLMAVVGLEKLLKKHDVSADSMTAAKEVGREAMGSDPSIFKRRPLPLPMLEYACSDADVLFELKEKIWKKLRRQSLEKLAAKYTAEFISIWINHPEWSDARDDVSKQIGPIPSLQPQAGDGGAGHAT